METINFTEIIIAVIGLLFTGILIPVAKNFIAVQKAKMTNEQLATFDYWAPKLITVAETIFDGIARGQDKKDWVISQLIAQNIIKESDAESVSDLITAICEELAQIGLINNPPAEEPNSDETGTEITE